MNKSIPQTLLNQPKNNHNKKKNTINPKYQKRKQTKTKKAKEKEKGKENNHNEQIEGQKDNIDKKCKNKEGKEKVKIDDKNKDISNLNYNEIRYFGKNINNLSSLEERSNQYIVNGSNFKKLFGNDNLFMNLNNSKYIKQNPEIDEIFNLLSIKYVSNPQYVVQYRKDILLTLLKEEKNNSANYIEFENILSQDIRLKYILFLIQVCDKITYKEEIHYLSINIFDRMLNIYYEKKKTLTEKTLQLMCFTSLFIAYKYETGYYFLLDDLINHTEDSLITKEQVLKFEYEINSLLDFDYLIVYPSDFLKHYELIDNINNKKIYYFCLYLIDFILSDTKLMSYKKSLLMASCYYIAKANLLSNNTWNNIFQFVTGYKKEEVKELAIKIIKEMKNTKNQNIFKCLRKKYSKEEFLNIADDIMNKKK